MISSTLFRDIHIHFQKIFACDKPFCGKSVTLCGNSSQISPVQEKLVYNHDTSFFKGFVDLSYGEKYFLAEIIVATCQIANDGLIALINQARIDNLNEFNKKLLKPRFIDASRYSYLLAAIYIHAENAPVDEYNKVMLERFETPLFQIKASAEYSLESKLSSTDIAWLQNTKVIETSNIRVAIKNRCYGRDHKNY